MKQRNFGRTGRPVSEIGLGCWQFGGEFGPMPEQNAFDIMEAALESGISFFDTADVYGGGRSERLIGEFLRGVSDKPFVATKFGRGGGVYPDNYSRDALRRCVEEELERLQLESLDLLQLHCVPLELLQRGEVFDWLRGVQEEGLIRAFGASVENDDQALACLDQPDLASLQIIFNVFRQKPLERILPRAKEQNVGVIVRLPLASGLLAGRYTHETTFAETDHRHFNRDGQAFSVGETFAGIPFQKAVDLADGLKPRVPEGMSMAQMALRWILDHEAVSVIIAGASSPDQARRNAAASDLPPLPEDLHKRLKDYYQAEVKPHIRGTY